MDTGTISHIDVSNSRVAQVMGYKYSFPIDNRRYNNNIYVYPVLCISREISIEQPSVGLASLAQLDNLDLAHVKQSTQKIAT